MRRSAFLEEILNADLAGVTLRRPGVREYLYPAAQGDHEQRRAVASDFTRWISSISRSVTSQASRHTGLDGGR